MEEEIYKVWKKTYNKYNWGHITWEVSDQGNVKKNGVPYECRLNNGYKVFGRCWYVHRVVAILFIPNLENKPEIDHINGDKLDNRVVFTSFSSLYSIIFFDSPNIAFISNTSLIELHIIRTTL